MTSLTACWFIYFFPELIKRLFLSPGERELELKISVFSLLSSLPTLKQKLFASMHYFISILLFAGDFLMKHVNRVIDRLLSTCSLSQSFKANIPFSWAVFLSHLPWRKSRNLGFIVYVSTSTPLPTTTTKHTHTKGEGPEARGQAGRSPHLQSQLPEVRKYSSQVSVSTGLLFTSTFLLGN